MGRCAINDEILMGIELNVARTLYSRERRRERKEFNKAMRKFNKRMEREFFREVERKHKKCGRARP